MIEANGWLYFGTHLGNYWAQAQDAFTGSHFLGYELVTGTFRDYGVIRSNYSCYSAVGIDRTRNQAYAFVTPFSTAEQLTGGCHIYRIDLTSGQKTDLGMILPGGPHHCFYFLVDTRGDCWFSLKQDLGALYCVRAATGQYQRWGSVLPEASAGAGQWWHWLLCMRWDLMGTIGSGWLSARSDNR